jgi:hypothetical protein
MTSNSPHTTEIDRPPGDGAPEEESGAAADRKWRRLVWLLALGAAIGIVVAALVLSADDEDTTAVGSEPATSTSQSASTTTSLPPTTTTAAPTTTAVSPTTAPDVAVVPPAPAVRARSGGGSGEVVVEWDSVAGATGYRVLRSEVPGGELQIVAEIDVTTGTATADDGVVNVWSQHHSYVPSDGTMAGPDRSPWFQVVEFPVSGQHCFAVIAHNSAGAGPESDVVCASPPG